MLTHHYACRLLAATALLVLGAGGAWADDCAESAPSPAASGSTSIFLKYLGHEITIGNNQEIDHTLVGGLSGIDYYPNRKDTNDPKLKDMSWVIASDDPASHPAGQAHTRFYFVPADPNTKLPDITRTKVMTLETAEPESIRFDPSGKAVWWTSESTPPFVKETNIDNGADMGTLAVPDIFSKPSNSNHTFEGLTFTADGKALWVSMESSLEQDGKMATAACGAIVRFTKYDPKSKQPLAQYGYIIDRLQATPKQDKESIKHSDNGVSEILAWKDRLLVLERSGVATDAGFKFFIRLYETGTKNADNVSLSGLKRVKFQPIQKQLVLNFAAPDRLATGSEELPSIDNIEGMTFGPDLQDGHRTLVLVSDNNFNDFAKYGEADQKTQILVFEMCGDRDCTKK